ncbi:uncharacterized protein LOC108653498 [Drosophila navojoa]|uniref:uncharacterized protein LOC108653498 n=1 Tax=Drosophila navojoa TaxID=7232 RepID=UPI0008473443|nr:uncharacterized protein LOC108653498 [Drosophila navojoa]
MCYSKSGFLCCISLYSGCISIGVSGVIFAIIGLVIAIARLVHLVLVWAILAIIFLFVYLIAKILLLLGVAFHNCFFVLLSFYIVCVSLILALVLCIWIMAVDGAILLGIIGFFFILVEIYFAWIVISYWNLCENCCLA